MTMQAADRVLYNGDEYELLGDSKGELPMLKRYGFEPICWTTGCYKGYIAKYEIFDNSLYLTHLTIQDRNKHYPEIGGIKPEIGSEGVPEYSGIREPMPITGSVVIGKDEADSLLLDFRAPHNYSVVLRLKMRDGVIDSVVDLSEESAALRSEINELKEKRLKQLDLPSPEPMEWRERYEQLLDRSWVLKYGKDEIMDTDNK